MTLYIPDSAATALVEEVLEQQDDIANVNYTEVDTSLIHGDQKIFAVNAYVDTEDEGSKLMEITVAIDMKVRDKS